MDAAKYHIELRDDTSYEVPEKAHVLDYGYSITVERPCRCACGDHHSETLKSWRRSEIKSARISIGGMSMNIVSERPVPAD